MKITIDRVGDWTELSTSFTPSKVAPSMRSPVTLIGSLAPVTPPRDHALLNLSSSIERPCSRAVSWRSAPKNVSGLNRSERSNSFWSKDPLSAKFFQFWTALALKKDHLFNLRNVIRRWNEFTLPNSAIEYYWFNIVNMEMAEKYREVMKNI